MSRPTIDRRPSVTRDAIVVGRHDYGDSDRIVRILTPDAGRVGVLARGARAARSRWTELDLGVSARVSSRPGHGDLELLADVVVLDPRVHLRTSLGALGSAAYLCELTGAFARESHPEPRLYGLLETALLLLDALGDDPGPTFRAAFEAKALTFAGVAPVLERCVRCGGALEEHMVFDHTGVAHRRCGEGRLIPAELALALERARRAPLRESLGASLPDGPHGILYEAVVAHLGRPLVSRAVLEAMV